jgi:hypothetical protein
MTSRRRFATENAYRQPVKEERHHRIRKNPVYFEPFAESLHHGLQSFERGNNEDSTLELAGSGFAVSARLVAK